MKKLLQIDQDCSAVKSKPKKPAHTGAEKKMRKRKQTHTGAEKKIQKIYANVALANGPVD